MRPCLEKHVEDLSGVTSAARRVFGWTLNAMGIDLGIDLMLPGVLRVQCSLFASLQVMLAFARFVRMVWLLRSALRYGLGFSAQVREEEVSCD